jgi:hypothetical protein
VTPELGLTGTLRLKVEEIAPSEEAAATQAAALGALVNLARVFATPLGDNAANNGLKELLKTAEVTRKHNRVVTTATLSPSLLSSLALEKNSLP